MTNQPKYSIMPVTDNDVEDMLNFLRRTFFKDEPLNIAVNLYPEEMKVHPDLDDFCRKTLENGVSLKAVDEDGNIIACVVNAVESVKEEKTYQIQECTDKKFQKILHILQRRVVKARLWEKYPHEKSLLDIHIAATDPAWRRRGIMKALIYETEKKAKEMGINLVKIDTSSAYSAMSAEKCGFTCIYKVAYKDIKLDGQPIIVPEEPHIYDCIFIKTI